jgi:Peptidase family C25
MPRRDGRAAGRQAGGETEVLFNGVSGVTGAYPYARTTVAELASMARGEPVDEGALARAARWVRRKVGARRETRNAGAELRLEEAGWGVIFGSGGDERFREALRPLLERREMQAKAADPSRHCDLWGDDGYRQGESMNDFLWRHRAEPGAADPRQLPYYLMLVGSPAEIPFHFQYELDLRHAVGRLDLDTPEDYAAYAASVVAAERASDGLALAAAAAPPRRAAFFCPLNPDPVSARMRHELVGHLLTRLAAPTPPGWQLHTVLEEQATRATLRDLLGGAAKPDFLFTACHGLVFPAADPRQRQRQGALLCHTGAPPQPPDAALAASDITDGACPHGLIAMHFGCYSAGTPARDEFDTGRGAIAPAPFTARLPQRLLAHPRGGALAVIGHVERTWTYSFSGHGHPPHLNTLEDLIRRLLGGSPVGHALELVNFRHAELAAQVLFLRERAQAEGTSDRLEADLAATYCATRDARNYVVLGDPAVRLLPAAAATGART